MSFELHDQYTLLHAKFIFEHCTELDHQLCHEHCHVLVVQQDVAQLSEIAVHTEHHSAVELLQVQFTGAEE
jgi:hypothetical protein